MKKNILRIMLFGLLVSAIPYTYPSDGLSTLAEEVSQGSSLFKQSKAIEEQDKLLGQGLHDMYLFSQALAKCQIQFNATKHNDALCNNFIEHLKYAVKNELLAQSSPALTSQAQKILDTLK